MQTTNDDRLYHTFPDTEKVKKHNWYGFCCNEAPAEFDTQLPPFPYISSNLTRHDYLCYGVKVSLFEAPIYTSILN